MWNMKCMIIPVTTGATEIVTKLYKNLETTLIEHSIDSLQKTVILGISHIMRKVLQSETWKQSSRDHRCFKKRNSKKKRPVTRSNSGFIEL
jgi:hypothetical protein